MFEKISNVAEKLATNVSESRRGFLGRLGRAALGAAGVVAGLLALPAEAQALEGNFCEVTYQYPKGFITTGYCVVQNPCRIIWDGSRCRPGGVHRGIRTLCRDRVTLEMACY